MKKELCYAPYHLLGTAHFPYMRLNSASKAHRTTIKVWICFLLDVGCLPNRSIQLFLIGIITSDISHQTSMCFSAHSLVMSISISHVRNAMCSQPVEGVNKRVERFAHPLLEVPFLTEYN